MTHSIGPITATAAQFEIFAEAYEREARKAVGGVGFTASVLSFWATMLNGSARILRMWAEDLEPRG